MKEFLAKGKRGVVHKTMFEGREAVVKEQNPKSKAPNTLKHEYKFLKEVNEEGIGPDAYGFEDGKLYMEPVEGERIIEYMESSGKEDIILNLKTTMDQLRRLDEKGINKGEMTYPYKHVIITDQGPVLIDFERARYSENPQNVTQFCQFLISKKIKKLLEDKGLNFDKKDVLEKARSYKDDYSQDSYEELLEEFGL